VIVVLAASLGLPGCGDFACVLCGTGGTGSSSGPTPTTRNFPSDAALDGMVFSNGAVVALGGAPFTGDNDLVINGVSARQFFSFDLSTLAAAAQPTAAHVYLRQAAVRGTPYASLGGLLLEAVNYGGSLDAGDFGLAPVAPGTPGANVLSTTATIEWKSLDVLAALAAARQAGLPYLQVRLRFAGLDSDANGGDDAVEMGDAEGSAHASSAPYLRVTYLAP
jgi:hypothetical protein